MFYILLLTDRPYIMMVSQNKSKWWDGMNNKNKNGRTHHYNDDYNPITSNQVVSCDWYHLQVIPNYRDFADWSANNNKKKQIGEYWNTACGIIARYGLFSIDYRPQQLDIQLKFFLFNITD